MLLISIPALSDPEEERWTIGRLALSSEPMAYIAAADGPAVIAVHQKRGSHALWLSVLPGPERRVDRDQIVDVTIGRRLVLGRDLKRAKHDGTALAFAPMGRVASIQLWPYGAKGSCQSVVADLARVPSLTVDVHTVGEGTVSLRVPTKQIRRALEETLKHPC